MLKMQIYFFAFLTIFFLACAPSEQQMIVRRQYGLVEISNYNTLSPRSQTGSNYGEKDDCTGEAKKQNSPPSENTSQNPPKEKTPSDQIPSIKNSPPQYQAPPLKKPDNSSSIVSINVPATLAFGKDFTGDATFYGSAGGGGACGFGGFQNILPGIAIGAHIFGQGEACGACVRLDPGKHGQPVVVQVDNKCPECGDGTDLSTEAWNKLTTDSPTRFPVSWRFVPCGFKEPIEIQWVSIGNVYDARFNFRRVSGAVLKAEISLGSNNWVEIKHSDTTSFVPILKGEDHDVLEQSSFTIRLTNVKGQHILCPNLNAASWESSKGIKDGNWLTCPDSSFQFTST